MHPAPLSDLSPVLADEITAHVYRRQVASELEWSWPTRARSLRACGEAAAGLMCRDCGAYHVVPYRCNARSCPSCARIASAAVVEKAAKRAGIALGALRTGDLPAALVRPCKRRWRLLTATTRAVGEWNDDERYDVFQLDRAIRAVRGAWGPFWRSTSWGEPVRYRREDGRLTRRARRDTLFAMGVEVAPGGMCHLHAAIYGEYVPQRELLALWRTAVGEAADRVRARARQMGAPAPRLDPVGGLSVNAMKAADETTFRDSLHEVLKYVNKGDLQNDRRAWRAANIELAMRGIRRVEMGGAFRSAKVSQADLIYAGATKCEECQSSAPRWAWAGLRRPDYVARNGGFGLDRIAADEHAREKKMREKRAERSTWPQLRHEHSADDFADGIPLGADGEISTAALAAAL